MVLLSLENAYSSKVGEGGSAFCTVSLSYSVVAGTLCTLSHLVFICISLNSGFYLAALCVVTSA